MALKLSLKGVFNARVCVFQLHEVYSRLCAQRQVSAVGQGECLSLCSLLESRGIFALKKAKEARLTKVQTSLCITTLHRPASLCRGLPSGFTQTQSFLMGRGWCHCSHMHFKAWYLMFLRVTKPEHQLCSDTPAAEWPAGGRTNSLFHPNPNYHGNLAVLRWYQ